VTLIAFELREGAYEEVARLAGDATGRLDFGVGIVEVCPAGLFGWPRP